MRPAFLLVLGLLSAVCLPAQPTSLSGPVEALTFDAPTRSLRAVIGFPGAASFGPALLDGLDFASVAPHQSYGLVFQNGRYLFVSGLGAKKLSIAPVAGITGYPDGIVWSADGSLAVVYSRAGKWFQTIAGLPAAPRAGSLVDVSSLDGSFTAIAVDSAGQRIAIAVAGAGGAVYKAVGSQFSRLASMAKPVSLSFSSDGQTLYALDAAAAQVTAALFNGNGLQTLALPGITDPIAIQSVVDSQSRSVLYVAARADRMVRVLDVATQQILSDVPLSFEPACLDPFGSGSFVLASRSQSSKPLWLFTSAPQTAAYFVPAVQLRQPEHGKTIITERTR